jgi:hypothetical protein
MCFADSSFVSPTPAERAEIHFCRVHPKESLGRRRYGLYYSAYEHACPRCLATTIADIPTHPEWFPVPVDPATIQLVLDVLYQKLGIEP